MNIIEGGNWVVRITKIPNVNGWVLVVIVGDDELRGDLWVPHHLRLPHGLSLILVLLAEVVLGTTRVAGWLREVENRFVNLEIPDDDLPVFTGTCENVWDNSVPADGGDTRTFVIVGNTWLEDVWLLHVGTDVLDEYLRATTCQEVLLVWVEFDGAYWHTVVDLGSGNATFTQLESFHR